MIKSRQAINNTPTTGSNDFNTLDEVVNAFFEGKTVHWKSEAYVVADWGSKDNKGHKKNLVVKCLGNGTGVGFFHADNIGSEHSPEDFYIGV